MNEEDFANRVKDWMKSEGRNAKWLADQCGVKLSVVYSWFSTRGFPDDQKRRINGMMAPEDSTSLIRVPFTDEQLRQTNRAAQIVSSEFQEYCQRAIAAQVEQDLHRQSPPMLRVAEDETPYKA